MGLPTIFNDPNEANKVTRCCCGGSASVSVNVNDSGNGTVPSGFAGTVFETPAERARRLITEANKKGFVIFQGV